MLEITPALSLAPEELTFAYARSGGPGGQNVNKVSSKVILRWNPGRSAALPADVRARFLTQQRSKLTKEGDMLITSQKTRDQGRNTEDCLEKLRTLILRAVQPPKVRKATKPSRGSKERRLTDKKIQGQRKKERQHGKKGHD
jgi:ribosome-associated protein